MGENAASPYGYPDERRIPSPYPLGTQVRRMAWGLGCLLLFRSSLRFMHGWRRWVLRLFGARLDDHACVQRTARIEFPWNLEMGRYASIGDYAWIYNLAPVTIGPCATVSQRSFLCTGSHDYTRPEMPLIREPITIGRGAWIAADVYVGPGISIGENAVIGARSVVTQDMPAGMVCAGHPCKPLKPRLPDAAHEAT